MKTLTKSLQKTWVILTASAALGAVASFIQIIERISYAENPTASLACDVNSVFSCTNVFAAWQSSVFGFSNAIMCLAFFAVLFGVGLGGIFSDKLAKNLRLVMHFFSVFFLLFGAWYLQQSTFVIGSLCIFCIFCYTGVIGLNWTWVRINANDLPLGEATSKRLKSVIAHGADTLFWILWGLTFVAMFILKFS
jgi:uncharacterized membrane protein